MEGRSPFVVDNKKLIEKADDVGQDVDKEEIIDLPGAEEVSEEMQALLATIDDLSESIEELTRERDELLIKLTAIKGKLAASEEQCVVLQGEVASYLVKLEEYEKYQVSELVDEIMRLRTQLGQLTDEEADCVRAALEQRTIESLRDTITDLKSEALASYIAVAPPHIETLAIPGEANATIEGVDDTPKMSSDEIIEKGLSLLFTGWRR